ncbi:MAG: hypothetical protein M1822_002759 [Bathelium mastoideum]|nr:MAG: hypothetical protein M1822_002759 [Bathelium mastoideum]
MFPIGTKIIKCIRDVRICEFPGPGEKGVFEYTFGAPFCDHYTQDGEMKNNFDLAMEGRRSGDPDRWFRTYPILSELGLSKQIDNERLEATLGDISGNRGYDLLALIATYPELAVNLVLEDLPSMFAHLEPLQRGRLEAANVQMQEYNFLTTPQPIVGAHAYLLMDVCHDWPDKEATILLRRTAEAMKSGYSRLLIEDHVLVDHDTPLWQSASDMLLMLNLSGIEQTHQQWIDLLASAHLKIVQTRRGRQSVIEVVKK